MPSGDQRTARPSSTILRGAPPSGAGTTHASKRGAGVPLVAPASKAIDEPSGEIARPPRSTRFWISSVVDAVRLIGSLPPRNLTHTSVGPRMSDRYAIHFPVRRDRRAGFGSLTVAICITRENEGARVGWFQMGRATAIPTTTTARNGDRERPCKTVAPQGRCSAFSAHRSRYPRARGKRLRCRGFAVSHSFDIAEQATNPLGCGSGQRLQSARARASLRWDLTSCGRRTPACP